MTPLKVRAVLFDLDGTLIDSAPDLAGAANDLRVLRDLAPLPYAALRPMAGAGARGMVGRAFGVKPGDDGYELLRDAFLARYAERLLANTQVFDAVAPVLQRLDQAGLPWGIVTNKAMRFAEPIVAGLRLTPAVVIGGDSTPHTKPHPAPLQAAARRLDMADADCVYIGDDQRDVLAGRAAGMATLAAGWGYLGEGAPIEAWGADRVLAMPVELLHWLELA